MEHTRISNANKEAIANVIADREELKSAVRD